MKLPQGLKPWLVALFSHRATRAILLGAIVLVQGAWIGHQYQRNGLTDFNVYYLSALGFRDGLDIYALGPRHDTDNAPRWRALAASADIHDVSPPYRYPPLTAQLTVPLLEFPAREAGAIWLVLTSLAFIASIWLMGRQWAQKEGAGIVYLLSLGLVPMLTTLHAGQVNGFVLLALTAGYVALARGRQGLAGSAIAVAALLKLLPFALVPYLAWRRLWKAFAAALATTVAIMLSAPLMFGADILSRYARNFFGISGKDLLYPYPTNQALSGVWARVLDGVLAPGAIHALCVASAAALVIATAAICWPKRADPARRRAEYALILCTLLLIPPYSWYHMIALALIPLAVTVEWLWRTDRHARLALLLALHLAMAVHGLFYHAFENSVWATSFPALYVLYLWASLVSMIRAAPEPAAAPVPRSA
ncbi:MAG: glycosyltransferase family 87 protein [Candidatus Dactylopiibacterium sp.]|nr:glycosyltransferase family 87 protein [Candidatus Dactylopiibacterium sp.]